MNKGYLYLLGRSNQPDCCIEILLSKIPKRSSLPQLDIEDGIIKANHTDKVFSWTNEQLGYSGPVEGGIKPYIECMVHLISYRDFLYLRFEERTYTESNFSESLRVPLGIQLLSQQMKS